MKISRNETFWVIFKHCDPLKLIFANIWRALQFFIIDLDD